MAETLAVAVLALAVSLLNLLLILGIVRRLRAQARPHSPYGQPGFPDVPSGPARGSRLPEFTVSTAAGGAVDDSRFAGPAACIAFVSTTCRPCKEALAELGPYLRSAGIGKEQALIVLDGDPAAQSPEAARAAELAEVVVGDDASRLVRQLGIAGFPTLIAIQDGVITGTALAVGPLSAASAAGVVPTAG